MFVHELSTPNRSVKLVRPSVQRDAALGVKWMSGPQGRETLRLMGVPDQHNHQSSLEDEANRVQGFLDNPDQYNWMIALEGCIVGTVWADLQPNRHIGAPAVSVMIGDESVRGGGVGTAALAAVVAELQQRGWQEIYARHLLVNKVSAAMLKKLGFQPDGGPYTDSNDLSWQNCRLVSLPPSRPSGA